MANIRVDVSLTIFDGAEVTFKSPCDCSQVTGLRVYYPSEFGETLSKDFAFVDAHGNDVANINELFLENAMVKVVLDCTHGNAFVQNADTNSYIESQFAQIRETLPAVVPNKVLWEWSSEQTEVKPSGMTNLEMPDVDKYSLFIFQLSTQEKTTRLGAEASVIGYKMPAFINNVQCHRVSCGGFGVSADAYYRLMCTIKPGVLELTYINGAKVSDGSPLATKIYIEKIIGVM